MRIVIDTNVVFSALYRPDSHPGKLILLGLEGDVELFAPDIVRLELERTLRRKLGYSDAEWQSTLEVLPISWVEHSEYDDFLSEAEEAISDGSDAPLVAVALLLEADIVSGDRAFHPLKRPLVRTWKPREAVETSSAPKKGRPPRRPRRVRSRR